MDAGGGTPSAADERRLHQVLMESDDGIRSAVTMLRCGITSVSVKRQMMERGIRVYEGGEQAA